MTFFFFFFYLHSHVLQTQQLNICTMYFFVKHLDWYQSISSQIATLLSVSQTYFRNCWHLHVNATHPRFWLVRSFFVCEFTFSFWYHLSEFYLASAVLLHYIKGSIDQPRYHQLWVLKIPTRLHFDIRGFLYSTRLSARPLVTSQYFVLVRPHII